jgi:hypothetical protein
MRSAKIEEVQASSTPPHDSTRCVQERVVVVCGLVVVMSCQAVRCVDDPKRDRNNIIIRTDWNNFNLAFLLALELLFKS